MKLLGISGSLRRASFNTGLLRHAQAHAPDGLTLDIADLSDVPLFNEDVEAAGLPEGVRQLRERALAADGLVFASTEYNYGMSGALKNAVDWLSRPDPADMPHMDGPPPEGVVYAIPPSPLTGKPAAMMGASAGLGGTIRSQLALRQGLQINAGLPMQQPEVFVTFAFTKFDHATGDLRDGTTGQYVDALTEAFVIWIERLGGRAPDLVSQATRGVRAVTGARSDGMNAVTEAGVESFPASDPPSWTGGVARS